MFEKRNFDNFDWTWISQDKEMWEFLISHNKSYKTTPYKWPTQLIDLISQRNCVIQAGGNSGAYAKQYSKYFKSVYTFEPDNRWFYCLNANATEENIFKFQCFLGDTNSKFNIQYNPKFGDTNLGGLQRGNIEEFGIPMMKVDDFNIPADLIHLDIEGYEYHALKGAVSTIKKYKPVIILEEKNIINDFGYTLKDLHNFLIDLKYEPLKIWKNDKAYHYVG